MKKTKRILTVLFLAVLLISALCVPAFALTESEVEAQVAASGKESVTGNVLIWFLCAVAFLKVSQKIDSFMATLGVNVGRTGGSMLAEAMIAMRAVTMVVGGGHGAGAGRAGSAAGSAAGKSGSSGMTGFFKGGLVGMAGRHITNSAVRTATTKTSAVHTAQSQVQQAAASTAAAQTSADTNINSEVHTGGSSIHTGNAAPAGTPPQEGIIVTGGGAPLTAPADNIPQAASAINSEVHTGGSHSHTQNDAAVGPPPQEGVIVTGGGAAPQMSAVESAPPVSPVPSGTPPQEGVILNGTEPAAIPQTDSAPQSVGTPPESVPPDMSQPQEGIVLTGGEQSVHAAQTENIFGGGTEGTVHVNNTAVAGGGQHMQPHTEQVRTSHTSSIRQSAPTGAGIGPSSAGWRQYPVECPGLAPSPPG